MTTSIPNAKMGDVLHGSMINGEKTAAPNPSHAAKPPAGPADFIGKGDRRQTMLSSAWDMTIETARHIWKGVRNLVTHGTWLGPAHKPAHPFVQASPGTVKAIHRRNAAQKEAILAGMQKITNPKLERAIVTHMAKKVSPEFKARLQSGVTEISPALIENSWSPTALAKSAKKNFAQGTIIGVIKRGAADAQMPVDKYMKPNVREKIKAGLAAPDALRHGLRALNRQDDLNAAVKADPLLTKNMRDGQAIAASELAKRPKSLAEIHRRTDYIPPQIIPAPDHNGSLTPEILKARNKQGERLHRELGASSEHDQRTLTQRDAAQLELAQQGLHGAYGGAVKGIQSGSIGVSKLAHEAGIGAGEALKPATIAKIGDRQASLETQYSDYRSRNAELTAIREQQAREAVLNGQLHEGDMFYDAAETPHAIAKNEKTIAQDTQATMPAHTFDGLAPQSVNLIPSSYSEAARRIRNSLGF